MKLEAREEVVSGSGSNKTTHRNVFLEKEQTLQAATVLQAGTEHRFPLDVTLPNDAPYSVDLSDNDLIWQAKVRVDIPKWPDWTKDLKIVVAPSGEAETKRATADFIAGDNGCSRTDRRRDYVRGNSTAHLVGSQ